MKRAAAASRSAHLSTTSSCRWAARSASQWEDGRVAIVIPALPHAAGIPLVIDVESSRAVVVRVGAWRGPQSWVPLRFDPPTTVPAYDPSGSFSVTGAEVLREVGLATTVAGTWSPLGPADQWALVRYYWAFDQAPGGLQPPRMALCPAAEGIRFHHRTALSEYVGVGVAIALSRQILALQYPGVEVKVVDAESALAEETIAEVTAVGKLRPDYLMQVAVPGGPLVVLECKGSRETATRFGQLAKAMRQLKAVEHRGSTPRGIAVHTAVKRDRFECTVLDHSDGDEVWAVEPSRPQPVLIGYGESETGVETSETGVEIWDVASFKADVEDLEQAKLLSWSGAPASANALIPDRIHKTSSSNRATEDLEASSVTIDGTTFEGIQSTMSSGATDFHYFRGLERDVRRLLLDRVAGGSVAGELELARRQFAARERSTPPERGGDEIVSVGNDGSVTRLSVTGRVTRRLEAL